MMRLHVAVEAGDVDGIRLALQADEDVNAEDDNGVTALRCASALGPVGPVRLLLLAGAAVDAKDKRGDTALMFAALYGHLSAVHALMDAGAAVNSQTNSGMTALIYASGSGHEAVVRALLRAGAAAASGVPALAAAIRYGHLNVVRLLLEAGAEAPPSLDACIYDKPGPNAVEIQQLLALHRDERRARAAEAGRARREAAAAAAAAAAEAGRARREAAEAAAAAAADALLAEEEAEKSSAESRQAKAKRKKQRQKSKRTEAVPGQAAQAGGAHSLPAPSGADRPSPCFGSRAAGAGVEEQRAALERGPEGASRVGEERDACAEEEERDAAVAAPLDPPPVVSVPAEELLCALEAAGSDGEVGEGGFGKVFAAELPSLVARWGRVAVKCASGLQAADILHEVATLRLCSHRNVLLLLGYCDDARAPCMLTPLMRGGSLDDRLLLAGGALERLRRLGLEGDARLDWQRRLSALCDAARGLAHLQGERILHRDVKAANILLEGTLRPLPMAHGPPLLVYRAVLSDVGLAKVREPTLGGTMTHATTRNLAFSPGFGDPALLNSYQHSEKTDAFGIGICVLMSLVSAPAAGLLKDHEEDVCEAFEDGTGPLFGAAHAAAGWPSDATRALAAMVHGLSMARNRKRQPLVEALA